MHVWLHAFGGGGGDREVSLGEELHPSFRKALNLKVLHGY